MAFNQRLFSAKLSNSFQSFKHWKELGAKKREVLLVSFSDFAHFVFAIIQQIKLDRYNELKDVVRLMSRSIVLQDKVTTDEYSGLLNSNIRQIYQTFSA